MDLPAVRVARLLVGRVGWLANLLALVGAVLLSFRRFAGAATFGAAGPAVALLYVLVPPGTSGHRDVPRVGAWLWSGSFLALTGAALIRRGRPPAQQHAEPGVVPDRRPAT